MTRDRPSMTNTGLSPRAPLAQDHEMMGDRHSLSMHRWTRHPWTRPFGRCLAMALVVCACRAWSLDAAIASQPPTAAHVSEPRGNSAELEAARDQAAAAHQRAAAARRELDAFLAEHFTGAGGPQPPVITPPRTDAVLKVGSDPERARLEAQLSELRAQRGHLLLSLTEAHPEVVDVDERIAALQSRIAVLGDPPVDAAGAQSLAEQAAEVTRRWSEYLARHKEDSQQAAAQYQKLLQAWQEAERDWEAARNAAAAAADRIASQKALSTDKLAATPPAGSEKSSREKSDPPLATAPAELLPAVPGEPPRKAAPPIAEPSSGLRVQQEGNQTLALAALLVALAVAALAAVRLARSGADPIFASADEAAAALALPVIGIVPAGRARADVAPWAGAGWRAFVVVAQVALAIALFSLIAYGIKNSGALWNAVTHPLSSIRSTLGI